MGLILNIETASTVCSVALAKNGRVVDMREDRQVNSHAKVVTVLTDDLIKASNLDYAALDAIAVSEGPGSYTGLRIGASVAKGLGYALNKPVITVPTLQALAWGIRQKAGSAAHYFMPVLDARRMDVYTAVYDAELVEQLPVCCVTVNENLKQELARFDKLFIGGQGMAKCRDFFGNSFNYVEEMECHAQWMAEIAERKFLNGQFADLAYFEPLYLKGFPAKQ
ncbi:MAG TPA: tRNA (adenosine(37)-N6)-threonylcarbamoyltransferase complex dimerization subunit type 1 TsaB [Chitinophagales bacterium]|nr:tRNA (adenosine(37)-N6)-threonylcarbamoyltransferase complex dimerization subunit type 1 TsaB [Chitinophagales bacterium]